MSNEPASAPASASEAAASPETDSKKAERGALIIAGGGHPAPNEKRLVAIVEGWTDTALGEDGFTKVDEKGEPTSLGAVKADGYSSAGDLYIRTSPDDVTFHDKARVETIGQDLRQTGFGGFAREFPDVHVGPASPVYAAANRVYQLGAKKIEIKGVTKRQRDSLEAWLANITAHKTHPADVEITFS